jgi:NUMOD4 motif.
MITSYTITNIDRIVKDEEFRPVEIDGESYPNYMVSNHGRVYSIKNNRLLNGAVDRNGYHIFYLCKNGKKINMRAHRLVAMHFIDNPKKLKILNHKDEIRTNNHYSNLEWCTHSYNLTYGDAQKRRIEQIVKPVIQMDDKLNIIAEYPSLSEASTQSGISITSMFNACTYGITKQGCTWAYIPKESGVGSCQ